MYTYDPKMDKKNVDKNSLNEEDLFLAGGFDSFSEPNQNLNVGTPYMSGVEQFGVSQEAVNRWKPSRILTFSEQMTASFNPAAYGIYSGLKIPDVKMFIKTFCRYYFIFVVIATMLILVAEAKANGIPTSTLFEIPALIAYVIVFGICYVLIPLAFRFCAWIYRLIARLICLIMNRDLSPEHLYSVSVYPLVPFLIISWFVNLISNFTSGTPFGLILASISLFMYIIPIIYMAIAIPRMK